MSTDSVSRREVLAIGAALLAAEEVASGKATAGTSALASTSNPTPAPAESAAPILVDRAFLRLSEGLVHYRSAGSRSGGKGLPLYLAHAGPGSSSAFEGYLPTLARNRWCFAPDMLGNGDSAPPASESVPITYYADAAVRVMDSLGVEQVDFYGSHTGAQIGIEIAAAHPGRIRRLILDGLPLFPADFKAKLIARYAPAVKPDEFGGHLAWAWNFARDQSLYWPYFERNSANRLENGVPPPELLHRGVTDILKALGTYHIAYHAAFAQDVPPVLAKLRCPVLLMASDHDPLSEYLDEAARLLPQAEKLRLGRNVTASDRVEIIERFLSA